MTKTTKNKIPQLRFPEFEGEWGKTKFKGLFDRISDKVDVKENELYLQIGIRSHGKGIFHKPAVSGKSLGNKRVFWIKENAFILNIVFAWEQAVAKTTSLEKGMIASHRFPMFKTKDDLANLDYFLRFFLTNRGKFLLELASPGGAGRNKTLGQKTFEELSVLHPAITEQTKIANFLSAVDRQIEGLEKQRELLSEYKKGAMQKLFSQSIRFLDDSGKPFPDWVEKRLGEVGTFVGGGTPSRSNKQYWSGNIPWISSSDLTEDSIYKIQTSNFITKEALRESAAKLIPAHSVLIVSRVGVGKIAVNKQELCTSQDFTNLSIREGDVIFFAYTLKTKISKLLTFNQGTSIKGFVKRDLVELDINIPSLPEQKKIAEFLSALDNKIDTVAKEISKICEFKKGLLQKMFV